MVFGIKKKPFSSKDSRFFDLLSSQSSKTLEGLEALYAFAENGTRENANLVRNLERGDEAANIIPNIVMKQA